MFLDLKTLLSVSMIKKKKTFSNILKNAIESDDLFFNRTGLEHTEVVGPD